MVQRQIDLPRPRDLEITYTPAFTEIVHELRGHIGAMRRSADGPPLGAEGPLGGPRPHAVGSVGATGSGAEVAQ